MPDTETEFIWDDELYMYRCTHRQAYVEPPCCDGKECGCGGMSALVCPASDCTGVEEWEIEKLFERLVYGR